MFDPGKLTREQQDELLRHWSQHVQDKERAQEQAQTGSAFMIFMLIILGGLSACSDTLLSMYIPHGAFGLAVLLFIVSQISKFTGSDYDPTK